MAQTTFFVATDPRWHAKTVNSSLGIVIGNVTCEDVPVEEESHPPWTLPAKRQPSVSVNISRRTELCRRLSNSHRNYGSSNSLVAAMVIPERVWWQGRKRYWESYGVLRPAICAHTATSPLALICTVQGGNNTTWYTQDENEVTYPVKFPSTGLTVVPIYAGGITQAVSPYVRNYDREKATLIYRSNSRLPITIAIWIAFGR